MKSGDATGNGASPLDGETVDHLLDFLSHVDEESTPDEVRSDLRQRGIDLDRLFRNVMADVERHVARRDLERAKGSRPSAIKSLQGIIADTARGVGVRVEDLRERAASLLSGPQQATFFRGLEQVNSEEDLQSLLDDIAYLDELQDGDSVPPTASDTSGKHRPDNR